MSLEANKAFAAVLTAGICFMVAGLVGGLVVHPQRLDKPAIETGEVVTAAAPAAPAALEPIAPLLASANVENGRTIASRQCAACHTFTEGGRNAVGPNLYGVVGGPHAHREDFNYSPAMKALHEKPWDYEALNAFLNRPAAAIPGTRMAFAGLNQAQQRADVIAYLRSLAGSPVPLP
ncbi:cytochrome c family protein [Roseomonas sp. SSH11]|uniref:Cytochrome c family protein n=1 Tax=Pararoseomonas baculiformis TaxID=2820812 RepID=A0ABS4ABM4_9PROT|nr:cytochrome c family protein [Pararoseomonas baculiformis]MBP0444408.1 cytochrome c family protein [Pararoseomonas baculiformis]